MQWKRKYASSYPGPGFVPNHVSDFRKIIPQWQLLQLGGIRTFHIANTEAIQWVELVCVKSQK